MVLVVPDLAWKAVVSAVLAEQTSVSALTLELEDGLPEQVVDRVRRAYDDQEPLAYLASNELSALDAIAAGADESLALRREEPAQVLVLIDRAQQRAHKRIALGRAQALAARNEKLEAIEAVVASLAHEINNRLSAMGLSVELLRDSLGPLLEAAALLSERAHAQEGLSAHEVASLHRTLQLEGIRDGSRVLADLLDLVESCAAIVRDLRTDARASAEETRAVSTSWRACTTCSCPSRSRARS